jgi:hypothetical protein
MPSRNEPSNVITVGCLDKAHTETLTEFIAQALVAGGFNTVRLGDNDRAASKAYKAPAEKVQSLMDFVRERQPLLLETPVTIWRWVGETKKIPQVTKLALTLPAEPVDNITVTTVTLEGL